MTFIAPLVIVLIIAALTSWRLFLVMLIPFAIRLAKDKPWKYSFVYGSKGRKVARKTGAGSRKKSSITSPVGSKLKARASSWKKIV